MRAARERGFGLAERDFAGDFPAHQVEFDDGGSVPERDVAALAVVGDHRGVGKRAGDALVGGKVKAENNLALRGIEQQGLIGLLAGDEEALFTADFADTDTGRVGYVPEFLAADFAAGNCAARSERKELLPSDPTFNKGIDGNAVAGV